MIEEQLFLEALFLKWWASRYKDDLLWFRGSHLTMIHQIWGPEAVGMVHPGREEYSITALALFKITVCGDNKKKTFSQFCNFLNSL